jgi:hypothetical protein
MARPTARNQRDLGAIPVGANNHLDVRITVKPSQFASAGPEKAVDGFGDQTVAGIDELLH